MSALKNKKQGVVNRLKRFLIKFRGGYSYSTIQTPFFLLIEFLKSIFISKFMDQK